MFSRSEKDTLEGRWTHSKNKSNNPNTKRDAEPENPSRAEGFSSARRHYVSEKLPRAPSPPPAVPQSGREDHGAAKSQTSYDYHRPTSSSFRRPGETAHDDDRRRYARTSRTFTATAQPEHYPPSGTPHATMPVYDAFRAPPQQRHTLNEARSYGTKIRRPTMQSTAPKANSDFGLKYKPDKRTLFAEGERVNCRVVERSPPDYFQY
jgi:hypothetical protein